MSDESPRLCPSISWTWFYRASLSPAPPKCCSHMPRCKVPPAITLDFSITAHPIVFCEQVGSPAQG